MIVFAELRKRKNELNVGTFGRTEIYCRYKFISFSVALPPKGNKC